MKYQREFDESETKEDFIKIMRKRKKVKKATALRRWYDYRKYKPKKKEIMDYMIPKKEVESLPLRGEHPLEESIEYKQPMKKPNIGKMLIFNDMKRYNIKITVKYLYRYGFKEDEINWLKEEGLI